MDEVKDYLPLVAVVVSLVVVAWQIRARRRDDKRAAQLTRLNRQLAELYGPLYALYEAGERNWNLFLRDHSRDPGQIHFREFIPHEGATFGPPSKESLVEYRRRMEELFMPTNLAMEKAIVEHADLAVGQRFPEEFSAFLAHVASAKLVVHQWHVQGFDSSDAEAYRVDYHHPGGLKHRIRASYHVLKEAQRLCLADEDRQVDEAGMDQLIEERMTAMERDWSLTGPTYLADLSNWQSTPRKTVANDERAR